MPNWCQNSIIIPQTHKKAFLRKFTKQVRHHSDEPVTVHVDFNRILRMPLLPEVMQRKWLEKNWGTTYNAHESDLLVHRNGDLEGMFEIRFNTAWGPVEEKLVGQIANRLQCNLKHIFFDDESESFGAHSYLWMQPLEGGDKYLEVIKAEEEDRTDTYCEAVEVFYGASEYAEELIERYKEATC